MINPYIKTVLKDIYNVISTIAYIPIAPTHHVITQLYNKLKHGKDLYGLDNEVNTFLAFSTFPIPYIIMYMLIYGKPHFFMTSLTVAIAISVSQFILLMTYTYHQYIKERLNNDK